MENILTIKQYAELCGCSYSNIHRKVKRGAIRTVIRDNKIYIPASEWLKHNQQISNNK